MNLFPDRLQFDTGDVLLFAGAIIVALFGAVFQLRGEVKGSDLKAKVAELENRLRQIEINQAKRPPNTQGNAPDENGNVPPAA
ncbi:MAG: hypothetical protein H3C27_08510 [Opitutaceae bacterium]|nr:hypothetical protein [Opitutaceae bacterium]